MKSTVSLVLEEEIIADLDRQAHAGSCSRSSIARVALQSYLATRAAIIEQPGHVLHVAIARTPSEAVALAAERNLAWAAWGRPHELTGLMPPVDATASETRDHGLAGALAAAPGWGRCPPQIVRQPVPGVK